MMYQSKGMLNSPGRMMAKSLLQLTSYVDGKERGDYYLNCRNERGERIARRSASNRRIVEDGGRGEGSQTERVLKRTFSGKKIVEGGKWLEVGQGQRVKRPSRRRDIEDDDEAPREVYSSSRRRDIEDDDEAPREVYSSYRRRDIEYDDEAPGEVYSPSIKTVIEYDDEASKEVYSPSKSQRSVVYSQSRSQRRADELIQPQINYEENIKYVDRR